MYAAALMPGEPGHPSGAILAAEALILAEEGQHHVNGHYYRSAADAAHWRRTEAERRVSKRLRDEARLKECPACSEVIEAWQQTTTICNDELHAECAALAESKERLRIAGKCSWCERRFLETDVRVNAGLRNEIHKTPCQAEFEAFVTPSARRSA